MADIKVLASEDFCANDTRYAGAVEVLEVATDGTRTIGLRLRVGNKYVPLPRSRITEVIDALKSVSDQASNAYIKLIEELNQ
jgi:hypothetical protein